MTAHCRRVKTKLFCISNIGGVTRGGAVLDWGQVYSSSARRLTVAAQLLARARIFDHRRLRDEQCHDLCILL